MCRMRSGRDSTTGDDDVDFDAVDRRVLEECGDLLPAEELAFIESMQPFEECSGDRTRRNHRRRR